MSFLSSFNEILVVSLVDENLRRSRAAKALSNERFSWVDGVPAESADVRRAYLEDRVHSHLTCFRHGPSCERLNCQNLLIPSQIATWMSHKKAITRVAQTGSHGCSLVLEDDFVQMSYSRKIDAEVRELLEAEFSESKVPGLMKLGWKKGPAHRIGPRLQVSAEEDSTTMSNPAYALNRRAAELLLEEWPKTYSQTVDVWLHRNMAPLLNSKRIDPPIFAESSSVFDFGFAPSLIHPKKPPRSALLSGKISFRQYLAEQRRYENHKKSVMPREILCVGHPRTGSGFMAAVFTKHCGLAVGHEQMKEAGISSWMFAGQSWEVPFGKDDYAKFPRLSKFRIVFNFVRDPRTALPSIVRELRHSPEAYNFLREEIFQGLGIDLAGFSNEADRAIASLRFWNLLCIERFPTLIPLRIERLVEDLADSGVGRRYLPSGDIATVGKPNANKRYKGHRHEAPSSQLVLADLSKLGKENLENYAAQYGYGTETPFKAPEAAGS